MAVRMRELADAVQSSSIRLRRWLQMRPFPFFFTVPWRPPMTRYRFRLPADPERMLQRGAPLGLSGARYVGSKSLTKLGFRRHDIASQTALLSLVGYTWVRDANVPPVIPDGACIEYVHPARHAIDSFS